MNGRLDTKFFSIRDGNLLYLGTPVEQSLLMQEAQTLLGNLQIPKHNEDMYYLSLIFCISSQRQDFEGTLRFIQELLREMRDTSYPNNCYPNFFSTNVELPEYLYSVAKSQGLRWAYVEGQNRFEPAFEYFGLRNMGREVKEFRQNPIEKREQLVRDVKWLAHKTVSFWGLCLGIEDLMVLDVHNYRQIAGLGINTPSSYYNGERRGNGKRELKSPSGKEYVRIEQEALHLLEGRINGALATTLFWIAGAKARRGMNLYQRDLFGHECSIPLTSPFK
ncbi:hypothetical protein HY500_00950 [Candidatus Woesearchaeota archaeon]|nr:hypothetical protein [Candidatus Woesearchaeota archaeon]